MALLNDIIAVHGINSNSCYDVIIPFYYSRAIFHNPFFLTEYTRPLFFRTSLIWILVCPDSDSERLTNEFKQRAPRVLPEMPNRRLPTLVNTVFCRVLVNNSAVLNLVNSVNALCILLRTVVLFYLLRKYICVIWTFSLLGQIPAPSSPGK